MEKPDRHTCSISFVGKGRNGRCRYWCLRHGADATARDGKRARICRYAHIEPITKQETQIVDISAYPGGIGIWGAVPPVYDTTALPIDRGVHVHARVEPKGDKVLDRTYRRVSICTDGDRTTVDVDELDAIYFMVSTLFDIPPQQVVCTHCGAYHLDKDWFSLHPHRRHLCSACGQYFRDGKTSAGNPAARAAALNGRWRRAKIATEKINLKQRDFPGGIQVWGSNPAIVWTAAIPECVGIHVHAFETDGSVPDLDQTYGSVVIDGVKLDPEAVRTHMAQLALPHLSGRIVAAACGRCGELAFDRGIDAYTPRANRRCCKCRADVSSVGTLRNVVSNPFVRTLSLLSRGAVRAPRTHDLGLLPEVPSMRGTTKTGAHRRPDEFMLNYPAASASQSSQREAPLSRAQQLTFNLDGAEGKVVRPISKTKRMREAVADSQAARRARKLDENKPKVARLPRHRTG